jgi:EmrB/QacA subfamily drug resistance transporter
MSQRRNQDSLSTNGNKGINKWVFFFIASFASFMVTLDAGIVAVSFPSLVHTFDTDSSTVVWVTLGYFIIGTGLLFTMGWIGDVMGRRNIYCLGIIIFTSGLALAPFSQTIFHLILIRMVQAIGHSMIMANALPLITQAFPSGERGKAMGIFAAVLAVGLGGGPVIGGLILDSLGWQAIFYSRIPLGIFGLVLAWGLLPKHRSNDEPLRIDYVGAIALFVTMGLFLFTLNQGGRTGFLSPLVLSMSGGTIFMIFLLIWVEKHASRPIIDLSLFSQRQFNIGLTLHYIHFVGVGAIFFLSPFYFINGLGYSPTDAGLFLTVFFVMRTFLSPASGTVVDKIGYRLPSTLGMGVMAIGVVLMSQLSINATLTSIVLSMVVAGFGSALVDPANTSSVMGSVSGSRLGSAAACVAAGRQIGLSTGIALGGAIFALKEQIYLKTFQDDGVDQAIIASKAIVDGFGDGLLVIALPLGFAVILGMMKRTNKRSLNQS